MQIYRPAARTKPETVAQFGELGTRGGSSEAAAAAWSEACFDDADTAHWLAARCFDPRAARALAELGVTPEQAAVHTRDGGDYPETIGFKVANGDLSARQGAARSLSSR